MALSSVSMFQVGNQCSLFSQNGRIWTGSDIFQGFSSGWPKGWLTHQSGNMLPPTATSRMKWNCRKTTRQWISHFLQYFKNKSWDRVILPDDRKGRFEYRYPLNSKYFHLQNHPFPRNHQVVETWNQLVRCRQKIQSQLATIPIQIDGNLKRNLDGSKLWKGIRVRFILHLNRI